MKLQILLLLIGASYAISAPTLRFKQGDTAFIRVHNRLKNEETSIHWHGLLLPNEMDGVPYLTTPPIPAGGHHDFAFPLKHAGTYWYHSHTGLQEQRGVYGAIVVEPNREEPVVADRDYVVVLSDWTDENPKSVMKSLMRGDEFYAIRKGNAQSILGAWQVGALKDYFQRERSRMAPMDVSDVAYDAFLANGKERLLLPARSGERIRLRFVNAGASTYFYLTSVTGDMTIVAADGPSVEPVDVPRLLIGMAETYDVIVTMPERSGRFEVRATAQDGSGYASVMLGEEGPDIPASDPPLPDLYRMDHMLEAAMSSMEMDEGHESMDMPASERPSAPYHLLRSNVPTVLPANAPRREITLRLTGDMSRYIWSFNDKTLAEDPVIHVSKGEVLSIKLVNNTMMHHPLHLHGHFFRVINGQGDFSPLKHTIDVPPMGRRTIEFEANDVGDWFFHCHLLYHMDAGMARVVSYRELGKDHVPSLDPKLINPAFAMVSGSVQTHMSMGSARIMKGRYDAYAGWDVGYHDHDEYEVDLGLRRYIDPNRSVFGGYRLTNEHGAKDRAFVGLYYRLPYLVDSTLSVDSEGDARAALGKEFMLTDRLAWDTGVQYDTHSDWEWETGLSYRLNKPFSLVGSYHSEHGAGLGLGFQF